MRYVVLFVALFVAQAQGQVIREGLSKMRQEGVAIMLAVYRRPDVTEWCEKNPEGEVTFQANGERSTVTVHCPTRREFLAFIEQPPPPQ